MTKILAISLTALLVTGCAAYAPINTAALNIGMSKQAAMGALGGRGSAIGSTRYEAGVIEVIQVSRLSHADSTVAEQYWLYFFNDELDHWGRPGDWRREADRIYEVRVR